MNKVIGTVTTLAPPAAQATPTRRPRERRQEPARVAWMALPALLVLRRLRRDPAARRAGAELHHLGRHRRHPRRPGSTSWRTVLTDPGLPHALWVTFLIMVAVLGGPDADEHPARGLPGRPPALPRGARGAVLHPAAAQLGGDRRSPTRRCSTRTSASGAGLHIAFLTQDWLGNGRPRPRRRRSSSCPGSSSRSTR